MALENFTTYTEVDPDSKITVSSTKCSAVGVAQNASEDYVYKDFGSNYFDGVHAFFELYPSNGYNNGGAIIGAFCLSNDVGAVTGCGDSDLNCLISKSGDNPSGLSNIKLWRGNAVATAIWDNISNNTVYYCILTRVAGSDTATLYIYSDSSRHTLSTSLSVSGFGTTKWQYCYGMRGTANGAINRSYYGYLENLEFKTLQSKKETIRAKIKVLGTTKETSRGRVKQTRTTIL
jgi:hypothetical protein